MSKLRFVFAVAMIASSGDVWAADSCKDILAGLYDFRNTVSDDEIINSLYNSSCSNYSSYNSQSSDKGGNIGLNVFEKFDFNLGGQQQSANINEEISELCVQKSLQSSKKKKVADFIRSVNSTVVQAWTGCMDNRGVNISALYPGNSSEIVIALSYRPHFSTDKTTVLVENTNIGDESSPFSDCAGLAANTGISDVKYYTCTRAGDRPGILWINVKERPAVSISIPSAPFDGKPTYSIATNGPVQLPDHQGGGIAEVNQDGHLVSSTRDSAEFISKMTGRYISPTVFVGYQTRTSKINNCQVVTDQYGFVTGNRKYCVDASITSSSDTCDLSRRFYQRTCIDGNKFDIEKYTP